MKKLDPRFINTIWMSIEKFISAFGIFFVTAAMAKYIGTYYYGFIVSVTTVFSFIYIISSFGIDAIIIKKGSINNKTGIVRSLGVTNIRVFLFGIFSFIYIIFMIIGDQLNDLNKIVLFLSVFIAHYIWAFDFISIVNDFKLKSKINVGCNFFALIVSLFFRYLFVKIESDIKFFSIPIIILGGLPFLLKLFIFFKNEKINIDILNIRKKYLKRMLLVGFPFFVSQFSTQLYIRTPIFLISMMLGYKYVGLYGCSSTIANGVSVFSYAIINSYIPYFYKENERKRYLSYINKMFLFITFFSAVISLIISNASYYIVKIFYGINYLESLNIINIMLISILLSILNNVFYHIYIKDNSYKFLMRKVIFCAIFSLPLTFFLIKLYGFLGAVYAMCVVEFISLIVINIFYKKVDIIKFLKFKYIL